LGAQQQQSQPVDCDKVNSEVMKLYSLAGLSKDSVAKAQQAGEQKRQAEEQAAEQERQAEEQQQKRYAEELPLKRREIEKTLSTNNPNSIGMKFVRIPAGSFVTGVALLP
ncbi:MAG: hypothetical protein LBN33_07020, partial [Desulfovibrio sp.]|nr:hypothetical protein [Desulfovibrio sp.]